MSVGASEGEDEGGVVGEWVGTCVGVNEGKEVYFVDGSVEGTEDNLPVGIEVGNRLTVGETEMGASVGRTGVGEIEGNFVGDSEGTGVSPVGATIGTSEGRIDGSFEGLSDGLPVGATGQNPH